MLILLVSCTIRNGLPTDLVNIIYRPEQETDGKAVHEFFEVVQESTEHHHFATSSKSKNQKVLRNGRPINMVQPCVNSFS